ncbi:tRNA (adenine(22)-N(1))-methyltransferase [Alkalibacterium olivapovliticus]|uniref:tRNA (Adenine22-N1)-methyltransferase n=1 Tax=Alkalibacterium olivapovliticus TaxID=99907 RepID=A0A2T0W9J1_9LACT|nr:tRNA (adenine(22)-N(1))-methyltransferase TrmK [Alkalibacterium olivapovliticus]PRY83296.1 tRNA (adenine22-N1)-methyltransferase [Alkalibacterium olivapovliticus]
MNSVNLSKRLEQVADYVEKGARLADIGSDHAYLPCYLAEKEEIEYAIAGEVVDGPFQNAVKEVKYKGLTDKIDVRLGDGLMVVNAEDQIDTITIAGMGGALIRSILEKGQAEDKITGSEMLILQPNVFEETVRCFLMDNQYEITAESILEENDKIYEIIKAVPAEAPVHYSKKECLFGPFLGREKSDVFKEKWAQQLKTDQFILGQIEKSKDPDPKRIADLKEEITLIKEMIT